MEPLSVKPGTGGADRQGDDTADRETAFFYGRQDMEYHHEKEPHLFHRIITRRPLPRKNYALSAQNPATTNERC